MPTFVYRPGVLRELERHGVRPTPHTPPQRVREYVRELYKYEIRRLRDQLLRGAFPRRDYATRVDALRRNYPVLALEATAYVEIGDEPGSEG